MSVDPADCAGSVDYEGKTYCFCSPHCVQKFQADPKRYLAPASPALVQLGGLGGHSSTMGESRLAETTSVPVGANVEYICPMDPEVVSDRPGSCPRCGMALEPR